MAIKIKAANPAICYVLTDAKGKEFWDGRTFTVWLAKARLYMLIDAAEAEIKAQKELDCRLVLAQVTTGGRWRRWWSAARPDPSP